jgi:hypothetical protein
LNIGEVTAKFKLDLGEFTPKVGQVVSGFNEIKKGWSILSPTGEVIKSGIIEPMKTAAVEIEKSATAQKSILTKLKDHWIAIAGSIMGAYMAFGKAKEYMQLGAVALQVEESFKIVSEAAGESSERIIDAMKKAAAETVDDSDIMQKAVKGMVQGLSGDQIIKIMETARVSARVAGEDVKTAYETITDAISTNMPRALRRYGLVTKEEIALVNKALAAGIEEVDLYGIAMANAAIQAAKMGPLHSNAAEQMQKTKAQMHELAETLGKVLIDALQKSFAALQWLASGALSAAFGIAKLLQLSAEFAAFGAEKFGFKETAAGMRKWAEEARKTAEDLAGASGELANKAAQNMVGFSGAISEINKKEIEAAQKTKEKWTEETKAAIEAIEIRKKQKELEQKLIEEIANLRENETGKVLAEYDKRYEIAKGNKELINKLNEWATLEAGKILEKGTEEYLKNQKEIIDIREESYLALSDIEENSYEATTATEKRRLEFFTRISQEETTQYVSSNKDRIDRYEAMNNALSDIDQSYGDKSIEFDKEKAAERWKIYNQMKGDIARFSRDETEFKKEMLEEQIKMYRYFGVNEVQLAKWIAIEKKKIDEEEKLRKGSFWQGMKVAMEQNIRDQKSWGEAGKAIFDDVFGKGGAVANTLQDFYTKLFKGRLDDMKDLWQNFVDALLAAFTKMLADMTTQYLVESAKWLLLGKETAPQTGGTSGGGEGGLLGKGWNWLTGGGGAPSGAEGAGGEFGVGGSGTFESYWGAGAGGGGLAGAGEAGSTAFAAEGLMAGGGEAAGAAAGAGAAGGAGYGALMAAPVVLFAIAKWTNWLGNQPTELSMRDVGAINPFIAKDPNIGSGLNLVMLMQAMESAYGNTWMANWQDPQIQNLFDLIKSNAWFDPNNLLKLFISNFGRQPTLEEARGDANFWFSKQAEYSSMLDQVLNKIKAGNIGLPVSLIGEPGASYGGQFGGIINEEIRGVGRSGRRYVFGEAGPEEIRPLAKDSDRPIELHVYLDGKPITNYLLKKSKDGRRIIHSRGLTTI